MAKKNEYLNVLKEDLGIEQINAFPGDISLEYDKKQHKLEMTLTKAAAGFLKKGKKYINMQEDSACFEAWCLIIRAQTKITIPDLKIELGVEDDNNDSIYLGKRPSNGHLGRFLYRILKFSEQYKQWFELSPTLAVVKSDFENYLANNSFVTNAPSKEAETDLDKLLNKGLESYVEQLLVDSGSNKTKILKLSSESVKVGRQLPVGLYEGTKHKDNVVFTGGTSAADFWAVDRETKTINVYELKSKNPMVGIITEIFFYSNYVYDVFIEKGNKMFPYETKKCYRNYDEITGKKVQGIEKVQGIMISNRKDDKQANNDGWHASLTEKESRELIIKIMNDNSIKEKIQYCCREYNFDVRITVTP